MSYKQRLELDWVGKDDTSILEPRILMPIDEKSEGTKSENMLIHGDNLLALKALESGFKEKIQCVYIDPPFNTQQAFEHYDDGVEHSIWLSMMKSRLEIIHSLMHESGTLFIHIDDNEFAYLCVLTDEIFGRSNRVSMVTFKQSSVSGPKAVNPGLVSTANYILVYAKDKSKWKSFKTFTETDRDSRYSKYIENYDESFENWNLVTLRSALAKNLHCKQKELKKKYEDELENKFNDFVLKEPQRVVRTARIKDKDVSSDAREFLDLSRKNADKVYRCERDGKPDHYFLNGEQLLFYSSKIKFINNRYVTGQALSTIWDDLLSNNLHKEGDVSFPNGKKPELLIKRCLDMSTEEGDWVLDSFLGSGTTASVAHKMNRKWIGIELRDHSFSHCHKRLSNVVKGKDASGITKIMNWNGGSGFTFYDLAPSLLQKDDRGNWVINKEYNAIQLSEAVCKHEKFKFYPNETVYWKQGFSSEKDFIFVTTQFLTSEHLDRIYSQMSENEFLLICAKAFRVKKDKYPNITLKKIPQMLLGRCEFGKDDYSLNIIEPIQEDL